MASDLSRIADRSRHLIASMSDIVWLVSPRRDSLSDLIARLADSYRELFEASNISFRTGNLKALKSVRLGMEFRQHVFLLLKEAMNNVLKHAECGEIVLDVRCEGVGFGSNCGTTARGSTLPVRCDRTGSRT